MRSFFAFFISCIVGTLQLPVHAQYIFTAKLGPYQQNFDKLGTGNAIFSNGTNATTVPGVIAGYNYAGRFASLPSPVAANDGSTTASAAYNFGATSDPDRSLGCIAGGINGNSGIGYICVRLRNRSRTLIKNLDIRYALEQWYNSSLSSEAYLRASYRIYTDTTSFTVNDLVQNTGSSNWVAATELDLQAPATGGILGKVDGNSTTYRRTAQNRLTNVNLPHAAEIVLRFTYIFNSQTNGNGISLDDLVVYPETNVLYSTATGMLDSSTATWGQAADGSNRPARGVDFTAANFTYYVLGKSSASRLRSGTWQVSGTNSRVVIGTSTTPATLYVAPTDNIAATVEVASGSTLTITNSLATTSTGLNLGVLATGSTVQYTAASQAILPATYSNLMVQGSTFKKLTGDVTVTQALTLAQAVQLTDYDLTLLRGATLIRTTGGQVVTNGLGEYRATVIGAGGSSTPVLFPVATSTAAADYQPATLTAGSADKDETYRVRVIDQVYTTYSTSGAEPTATNQPGPLARPETNYVTGTWFISHETMTPLAATLKLGWAATKQGESFTPATAYIDHYTAANGTWDGVSNSPGSFADDGQLAVQRTGVTTFSPFAVTSKVPAPLPVELVSFQAHYVAPRVRCTWTTANERDNAYFLLERSSDGVVFQPLDTIVGRNLGPVAHTYYCQDERPFLGLAYYRLQQVDKDGTTTFSPVVVVRAAAPFPATAINVSPNPGTGHFTLQTAFDNPTYLQGSVVTTVGQQVLSLHELVSAGAVSTPLDLRDQPAGLYLLRLVSQQGAITLRLLKY